MQNKKIFPCLTLRKKKNEMKINKTLSRLTFSIFLALDKILR